MSLAHLLWSLTGSIEKPMILVFSVDSGFNSPCTELGGAHGREVLGMREQDRPFVPDPFVETDSFPRWFPP